MLRPDSMGQHPQWLVGGINERLVNGSSTTGSPTGRSSQYWWSAAWVAAICIGITLWVSAALRHQNADRFRAQFETEATRVEDILGSTFDDYKHALRGGQSLFNGSPDVTHEEWAAFVQGLAPARQQPGLRGLGVIGADWNQDDRIHFEPHGRVARDVQKDFTENEAYGPLLEKAAASNRAAVLILPKEDGDPESDEDIALLLPIYAGEGRPASFKGAHRWLAGW